MLKCRGAEAPRWRATGQLPSGKKCFVFIAKRDQDGAAEPVLCFVDSQNKRLMWLDEEEVFELERLAPRLKSYLHLWERKAAQEKVSKVEADEEMKKDVSVD
ncbi:unnamed protein product [Vitrella brassicaformis CCMP3155]|uniref:Uncharacterized protein n=1 Tax=Vitrella brassicaformis (strain CCMP3155) TaxID=1169540 RepID=A0A0G4GRD6_VITBC|nr:unnamed protein product [Vitrella brassicaformis CCMP3155]|eukprot:CEM33079.1 unnamed protein product [Vitrella brassicaformis CCMP3155]